MKTMSDGFISQQFSAWGRSEVCENAISNILLINKFDGGCFCQKWMDGVFVKNKKNLISCFVMVNKAK